MSEVVAEAARNYPKPNGDAPRAEAQAPQKSAAREYGEAFGIALILALIIRTFFIQAYKIPSGSMEPTLLIGDHILVNKLIYGLRVPDSLFGITFPGVPWGQYLFPSSPVHRGDVVVFVFPPDPDQGFHQARDRSRRRYGPGERRQGLRSMAARWTIRMRISR